jgi:phosphate-selective porin OprO and OprP
VFCLLNGRRSPSPPRARALLPWLVAATITGAAAPARAEPESEAEPPREYEGPAAVVEDEPEPVVPAAEPVEAEPTTDPVIARPVDPAAATTPREPAKDPREQPWLPPQRGLSIEKAELDVGKAAFVPGKGISLVSKDDRFAIALSLRTSFQYTMLHPNDGETAASNGLEIRRFRTVFQGHVFGKHNRYFLQLAFGPREVQLKDGTLHSHPVYDAYLQFERFRDLTLRVGMYRPQYSRERLIQDINPLLIDRSVVNNEFNLDRDIGLDLRSEDFLGLGRLRYFAGVFMGEGRNAEKLGDFGLLYTGRVDVMPVGKFDDYDASDQTRLRKFRLSMGAAYAFQDNATFDRGTIGSPPADGGTTDYHNATADLMIKIAGFYLEAGYLFRKGKRNPGSAVDADGVPIAAVAARNGQGWFAQIAMLIPRTNLEPAMRVSQIYALHGSTSLGDSGELGGGLNYYFAGHNLKLQADFFRLWQRADLRHGTDQLRVQLQVAF